VWVGAKTKPDWRGYAIYGLEGKTTLLHRELWKNYRGPLRDDQQLDHLCRNRACINLDHLEPVSCQENHLRGYGLSSENAGKTHCPKGHEYSDENTYLSDGRRHCRACRAETGFAWKRANTWQGGVHGRDKTHCKHGHPFNEENTYYRKLPNGQTRRTCRACVRSSKERYLERLRSES
jgi:hypothetical protein